MRTCAWPMSPAPLHALGSQQMLHTTVSQFIVMASGIVAGTLLFAGFWAGLEKVYPPLKGYLARR